MKRSILLGLTASSLTAAAGTLSAQTAITVDRSTLIRTSELKLGITHTSLAIDSSTGTGTLSVKAASAARAAALLQGVPKINNIHLDGFGANNPQLNANGAYNWTSLDARQEAIRPLGGDMCLTLCSAPGYMQAGGTNGTATDVSKRVEPQYNNAYADLCVAALLHAKANNQSFKYVQVWNEFKGYYDSSITQYGGWDVASYTSLYNTVYDKIKATAGLEDVKVGGLYFQVSGSGSKDLYGNSGTGTWQPFDTRFPQFDKDEAIVEYWLQHKHGADFMTIDRGLIDSHDPNSYTPDQRIQLAGAYARTLSELNRIKSENGADNLPVWMSEYYGLERYPNGTITQAQRAHDYGSDAQEAALNALFYKAFVEQGLSTALMWNGGEGESHHGMYTDIRDVNDFGDATPGSGGYKTLHYDVFKDVNEYFGAGRPIVKVTSGDATKVDALASTRLAMLINKTGVTQLTSVNGRSVTLAPYEVKMSTLLPQSFDFAAASDYDANFKEGTVNGIYRESATGKLRVANGGTGMAVLDMRATAGANGVGGTGGLDANVDLDNFSISARTRTTAFGNTSQVGFLLRLNDNEAGGYLALASFDDATGISFRLFEGASLESVGTQIYINSNRAAAPDLALNTDYFFRVTAVGSQFTFEWLNSAGTVVYTQTTNDGTLTSSVGQAGVRLRASGETVYLDDLTLALPSVGSALSLTAVPEPTSLAAIGGAMLLMRRRR